MNQIDLDLNMDQNFAKIMSDNFMEASLYCKATLKQIRGILF